MLVRIGLFYQLVGLFCLIHRPLLTLAQTYISDAAPDSALAKSPVARLSGLIGTPRDMSSAAAAQLRRVLLCKLPSLPSSA